MPTCAKCGKYYTGLSCPCSGSHPKMRCPTCNGAGYYDDPRRQPWEVKRPVTCLRCKGTGKV